MFPGLQVRAQASTLASAEMRSSASLAFSVLQPMQPSTKSWRLSVQQLSTRGQPRMANAIVVRGVQPALPETLIIPGTLKQKQSRINLIRGRKPFLCPTGPHGDASKVASSLLGPPAQDTLPRLTVRSPSSVRGSISLLILCLLTSPLLA